MSPFYGDFTPACILASLRDFLSFMEEGKTPHAGKANAPCGKGKRPMRERPMPHRAFLYTPFEVFGDTIDGTLTDNHYFFGGK